MAMAEAPPLYPQVVVGYVENERGEDARLLAERIAERDGGELKVVHVEKGSPADALQALAERGDADLIVLGLDPPCVTSARSRRAASPNTCCTAQSVAS